MTRNDADSDENETSLEELDEEIEVVDDSLYQAIAYAQEAAFELDNPLAEYDFLQVKRILEEFATFIEEIDAGELKHRAKLAILRNGSASSGESVHITPIPLLTKNELPAFKPPDREIDYHDARMDHINECVNLCDDH